MSDVTSSQVNVVEGEIVSVAGSGTEMGSNSSNRSSVLSKVFNVIKKTIFGFIRLLVIAISGFFKFFLTLTMGAKVVFILILVVFSLIFYFVGFSFGERNINNEIKEKTGYGVDELDELKQYIDNLNDAIDSR